MLAAAGIRNVRVDFDWSSVEPRRGEWRFKHFDTILDKADKYGITILPILGYWTSYANPAHEHLDLWREYVSTVMNRYKGRFPVVEVWNEPNLGRFWHNPSPAAYTRLLACTYEAAKSADPQVKVAISGFSQVPFDFIEGIYKAGGGASFDIMNVHPYSWPIEPEKSLVENLAKLRRLMAEQGDAEKPIWITEIGWPNATGRLAAPGLLKAGLSAMRPEIPPPPLRVLYCDIATEGSAPKVKQMNLVRSELPNGSTIDYSTPSCLGERLETGAFDVAVLPLSLERYHVDSVAPLERFVADGGTLVLFGGAAMFYPFETDGEGVLRTARRADTEVDRKRLRVHRDSWSVNTNLPKRVKARATQAAMPFMAEGRTEFWAERYFSPRYLHEGDEFIPLLAGTSNDGIPDGAVAACVYRFGSDWKGSIVASGLFEFGVGVDDERSQASKLARSLAIAMDSGVERFFNYEFRAPEKDESDPESHFGMVHVDFSPKEAFLAYRAFVAARPSGSANLPPVAAGDGLFALRWRRPDGRNGAAVWMPGSPGIPRRLEFSAPGAEATDFLGRPLTPVSGKGASLVFDISENPVYLTGPELVSVSKQERQK